MTQNASDFDFPSANGETIVGNGTSQPVATTLTSGTNCTVVNGANSIQLTYTGSTAGDWFLTHSASASASSELTFTGLSSTYFEYMLVVDNFQPAVDSDRLAYQTSTDNGVSYDSGASNYYFRGWFVSTDSTTGSLDGDGISTNIIGSSGSDPGNATNESCSAISWFYNPSAADFLRSVNFCTVIDNGGDVQLMSIHSGRKQAVAVNAIRLFCVSGNIATAEVRIYGKVAA